MRRVVLLLKQDINQAATGVLMISGSPTSNPKVAGSNPAGRVEKEP